MRKNDTLAGSFYEVLVPDLAKTFSFLLSPFSFNLVPCTLNLVP
ncbi:MAG: hypothetical protein WCD55_07365 [Bacteroidales bacterium]